MSRLKNSLLVFVSSVSIVCSPVICYSETADPVSVKLVTNLDKEQRAPFKGILLSEEAAAKLFADIKFSRKECDAELAKNTEVLNIKNKSAIDILKLNLDVEKTRLEGMIGVRDDRIKFLEKNYMPPAWYESQELWFAFGILAGIGVTAAAGYAIGQAN